ncbi:hypothetical protein BT96DRAFT_991021 [Gymnopus androsaceus JB14]|uniref:Uncharacterized protein n=1 Tax=Gymnopus androsaceus JB14 TaxID=1447944 RepID=A0A6A4HTP4_9AGAR|nr:hypothetical protein BT96DRAFT_991021 [Gymnopus androsaceus JB14]
MNSSPQRLARSPCISEPPHPRRNSAQNSFHSKETSSPKLKRLMLVDRHSDNPSLASPASSPASSLAQSKETSSNRRLSRPSKSDSKLLTKQTFLSTDSKPQTRLVSKSPISKHHHQDSEKTKIAVSPTIQRQTKKTLLLSPTHRRRPIPKTPKSFAATSSHQDLPDNAQSSNVRDVSDVLRRRRSRKTFLRDTDRANASETPSRSTLHLDSSVLSALIATPILSPEALVQAAEAALPIAKLSASKATTLPIVDSSVLSASVATPILSPGAFARANPSTEVVYPTGSQFDTVQTPFGLGRVRRVAVPTFLSTLPASEFANSKVQMELEALRAQRKVQTQSKLVFGGLAR